MLFATLSLAQTKGSTKKSMVQWYHYIGYTSKPSILIRIDALSRRLGAEPYGSLSRATKKKIAEVGNIDSLKVFFDMHQLELKGYGTKRDILFALYMGN